MKNNFSHCKKLFLVLVAIALAACASNFLLKLYGTVEIIQGYYPYWLTKTTPPSDIDLTKLTHLSHAFIWPKVNGEIGGPTTFNIKEFVDTAKKNNVVPLVCIGDSEANKNLPSVLNSTLTRKVFVKNLRNFIVDYGYKGVELDWEFPTSKLDGENITKFIKELRQELGTSYTINVIVAGSQYCGSQYYEVDKLLPLVSHFVLMTYDYGGTWSKTAAHNVPLYGDRYESCFSAGVEYWLGRGVPPRKIIAGLAFYGRSFDAYAPGQAFTKSESVTIANLYAVQKNYERLWDSKYMCSYFKHKTEKKYVSCDDPASFGYKMKFIKEKGCKGVMIWHVGGDLIAPKKHVVLQHIFDQAK